MIRQLSKVLNGVRWQPNSPQPGSVIWEFLDIDYSAEVTLGRRSFAVRNYRHIKVRNNGDPYTLILVYRFKYISLISGQICTNTWW